MSHGANDPAVLDQIREDTGGDGEFVVEIIDDYITDARARLVAFATALAAADVEAARDAVHSLKGTSASLGAHTLADVAMEAEQRCREGAIDTAAELLPQLEAGFALVALALVGERSRFGAPA